VRFDSADGHHAAFSYFIDGHYAGSWLISTANKTLDKIGVYVQSKTSGAAFEFDELKVYGQPHPNGLKRNPRAAQMSSGQRPG